MSDKVRILVADDHSIVIEGIKYLLEKSGRYKIVAEALNGPLAVDLAKQHNPDIIILDFKMPGMSGIEASRCIKRFNPEAKILAFSANISTLSLHEACLIGIQGFVHKLSMFEELYKAVEALSQGSTYQCPHIRSIMASCLINGKQFGHERIQISEHEKDLIQMLTDGKSVGEIGLLLNKSPKTIDARRRKIMNQLGLTNLADLTKYAITEGITSLDILS